MFCKNFFLVWKKMSTCIGNRVNANYERITLWVMITIAWPQHLIAVLTYNYHFERKRHETCFHSTESRENTHYDRIASRVDAWFPIQNICLMKSHRIMTFWHHNMQCTYFDRIYIFRVCVVVFLIPCSAVCNVVLHYCAITGPVVPWVLYWIGITTLTHRGCMTHVCINIIRSSLVQIMASRLFNADPLLNTSTPIQNGRCFAKGIIKRLFDHAENHALLSPTNLYLHFSYVFHSAFILLDSYYANRKHIMELICHVVLWIKLIYQFSITMVIHCTST